MHMRRLAYLVVIVIMVVADMYRSRTSMSRFATHGVDGI